MRPEYCPFHRAEDSCPVVARILIQGGLIEPSPSSPVPRSAVIPLPSVPPVEVSAALIAVHLNTWAIPQIDSTLPLIELATADWRDPQVREVQLRSIRFTVKAVQEKVVDRECITRGDLQRRWRVDGLLREAESEVHVFGQEEPEGLALRWFIALLRVQRARAVWSAA